MQQLEYRAEGGRIGVGEIGFAQEDGRELISNVASMGM